MEVSSPESQAYIAEFEGILWLNRNIWPWGGETGGQECLHELGQ